jgi:hypothetical protein
MTDDIAAIRAALGHIDAANRGEGVYGLRSSRDNFSTVCSPDRIARLLDALEQAQKWRGLYRRAVNEANGLTNYVEDRPELTRAERKLTAIEAEARAIDAAMAAKPEAPQAP